MSIKNQSIYNLYHNTKSWNFQCIEHELTYLTGEMLTVACLLTSKGSLNKWLQPNTNVIYSVCGKRLKTENQ